MSKEDRRAEGGAWAVALLGFIVATPIFVAGHGLVGLYVLIGALVLACVIYYRWYGGQIDAAETLRARPASRSL